MQKLFLVILSVLLFAACSTSKNYSYINGPIVRDIDGNIYPSIVTSCGQTWVSKNLSVSRYKDGTVIPQVTDATTWANMTTGAWCYYKNNPSTEVTYGRLYNWYAVNDPRGIAPQGWHVPTDAEWNKLVKCIDPAADTLCQNCTQSSTAGGAMKEAGTSHWSTPNTGATNSSGFEGLPGGYRSNLGKFGNLLSLAWWSASEYDNTLAWARSWARYLYYNSSDVYWGYDGKTNGFSVRVVRD